MKKITLGLFLVCLTLLSFGQYQPGLSGDGSTMSKFDGMWELNGSNIFYNSGFVGIGTDSPSNMLTIEGSPTYTGGRTFIKLKNNSTDFQSCVNIRLYAGDNDSYTSLTHHSDTYTGSVGRSEVGQLWNHGNGLILKASGAGLIRFETDLTPYTVERMRINEVGNVGINTTEPKEKLVVNGNLLILNNYALILTSPNGTQFEITVDDDGNLSTSDSSIDSYVGSEVEVSVYPNPASDKLSVEIENQLSSIVDAEIYEMSGKMVFMKKYNSSFFDIRVDDLVTGSYLLKLKDESGKMIKIIKFLKQ